MKVGNKPIYAHVYVALSGERSVMVYADWGDYFHHLSSITDKDHFMKIMERPCPTFVQIWECEHPDNVTVMSLNAGDTMGVGIEIEDIDWQSHPSMELPFIPEIQKQPKRFSMPVPNSTPKSAAIVPLNFGKTVCW